MTKTIDEIVKAKVRLVTGYPFFGSLVLRYPTEITTSLPTMATDGKVILCNEEFCAKHTRAQITGVFAHEVLHIAFMHHIRKGSRDHQLWNIACDFAINPLLKEAKFELPEGALDDKQYHGMTAERIYDLLMQDIASGKIQVIYVSDGTGEGDGDSPGKNGQDSAKKKIKGQGWGGVKQMPGANDPAKASAEAANVKVAVMQAATTAKKRGSLPSCFEGLIEEYRAPQVDWRTRLRTFVGGNKPTDWSFRRPNRKHMALNGMYLPTVENTGAGIIVIGVDSSGSVGKAEMEQFMGEIKSIHSELQPEELHVVWCDAQIQHVDFYTAYDEFNDKTRHGCGGTVLRPVFDWITEKDIQPHSMIMLTDGEYGSDMDSLAPNYPVLFVSTGSTRVPFGESVKIDVSDR